MIVPDFIIDLPVKERNLCLRKIAWIIKKRKLNSKCGFYILDNISIKEKK